MTDDDRPVRLVLDRSAVLAYLGGSVHVGEPIREVTADRNRFGVTSVTVAETQDGLTDPKDRAALRRLVGLDACVVLPTSGECWEELGYWRTFTGRADAATTVMAALEWDASILTREARYGHGELPVIYLPA
jgi:hypothetical protein